MSLVLVEKAIAEVLSPDAAAIYREEQRKREVRDAVLAEQVRKSCVDVLERIASAMRYPRIAEADLNQAAEHILIALKAAQELDK